MKQAKNCMGRYGSGKLMKLASSEMFRKSACRCLLGEMGDFTRVGLD